MTGISKPVRPFSSAHVLARVVIAFLALSALIDLIAIASGYFQVALLSQSLADYLIDEADASANDTREQIIAILELVAYLIAGILFLVWIYRANRNLRALKIRNPKYSPGWAVALFFVPFVNLYFPFDIVRTLWKESNPDIGISDKFFMQDSSVRKQYSSESPLIGLWWGCWIVSGFTSRISSRLSSDIDQLITATWVEMASDAIGIIGTVCLILIVKEIDERQEEKHRRLTRENISQPGGEVV